MTVLKKTNTRNLFGTSDTSHILMAKLFPRVDNPHHGSTKSINIDPSSALFESISAPLNVATYNSLCVKKSEWKNSEFDVIAWSSCGDVEAIERNIEGRGIMLVCSFIQSRFLVNSQL